MKSIFAFCFYFVENRADIFNIHCEVQRLLDGIKRRCGCEDEGTVAKNLCALCIFGGRVCIHAFRCFSGLHSLIVSTLIQQRLCQILECGG